jgi:hypothetical protein
VAEASVEAARAAAAMAPADGVTEVVEAVTRVVRLARAAGRAAPAARAARVVEKVAEASKVALAEMVLDRVVVEAKVPATQPTAETVGLESWLSPMQLLGGKLRPACASFPCRFVRFELPSCTDRSPRRAAPYQAFTQDTHGKFELFLTKRG